MGGMHGWFEGGAGLINEQRAFRPHSRFVIFTPFAPSPSPPNLQTPTTTHPIPPPVKSVLAGPAIKFRPYERGHSFKKAIYHQPSPEDRFRVVVFFFFFPVRWSVYVCNCLPYNLSLPSTIGPVDVLLQTSCSYKG